MKFNKEFKEGQTWRCRGGGHWVIDEVGLSYIGGHAMRDPTVLFLWQPNGRPLNADPNGWGAMDLMGCVDNAMTPIDPWKECNQALEAIEAYQATPEARQPGLVAEVHQDKPASPEACSRATKSLCGG